MCIFCHFVRRNDLIRIRWMFPLKDKLQIFCCATRVLIFLRSSNYHGYFHDCTRCNEIGNDQIWLEVCPATHAIVWITAGVHTYCSRFSLRLDISVHRTPVHRCVPQNTPNSGWTFMYISCTLKSTPVCLLVFTAKMSWLPKSLFWPQNSIQAT
jgi:hypothetical protein